MAGDDDNAKGAFACRRTFVMNVVTDTLHDFLLSSNESDYEMATTTVAQHSLLQYLRGFWSTCRVQMIRAQHQCIISFISIVPLCSTSVSRETPVNVKDVSILLPLPYIPTHRRTNT